jgi:hypothetical protein
VLCNAIVHLFAARAHTILALLTRISTCSARSRLTNSMPTLPMTTCLTGTFCCAGQKKRPLPADCTTAESSSPHSTRTSRRNLCSCARRGDLKSARRFVSASRSTILSSGSQAGTSVQVRHRVSPLNVSCEIWNHPRFDCNPRMIFGGCLPSHKHPLRHTSPGSIDGDSELHANGG